MSIIKFISAILLTTWVSTSSADNTLKPFISDSLQQITVEREGQSFLLVFWSIDCPPCLKELSLLQKTRQRFSEKGLVLVSTDDIQHSDSVKKILQEFQLEQLENWIFSDAIPERLRYAIDPAWYGELPRAYFYNSSHQRKAHSGSLKKATLDKWLQATRINLSDNSQNPPVTDTIRY